MLTIPFQSAKPKKTCQTPFLPQFHFHFTRKNKFYAHPLQERTTDAQTGYKFIPPFTDPKFDVENQRKERSIGIQNKAVFFDKPIQTSWNRKINVSVQCSMTDSKAEEESENKVSQDENKKILKFINSSYHRFFSHSPLSCFQGTNNKPLQFLEIF